MRPRVVPRMNAAACWPATDRIIRFVAASYSESGSTILHEVLLLLLSAVQPDNAPIYSCHH